MIPYKDDEMITASNDCTIRFWNLNAGNCLSVFKFADPIATCVVSKEHNMLFTGSWDKMVRAMDLKENTIIKSFIASKDAIKCIRVSE